jgi:hypothetical protein
MFDIREFIKTNLIQGVKNGSFTREYANILGVNYLTKGLVANEDLVEIDLATAPEPIETLTEEIPEEVIV